MVAGLQTAVAVVAVVGCWLVLWLAAGCHSFTIEQQNVSCKNHSIVYVEHTQINYVNLHSSILIDPTLSNYRQTTPYFSMLMELRAGKDPTPLWRH